MRLENIGRAEHLLKEIHKGGEDRERALGLHRTSSDGGVDDEVGGRVVFRRRGAIRPGTSSRLGMGPAGRALLRLDLLFLRLLEQGAVLGGLFGLAPGFVELH